MRVVFVTLGAVLLTACASTAQIDGYEIRGTPSLLRTVTDANDLHKDAPAWLQEYWRQYLADAEGRYAVMAMDRNGLGASYVYCAGSSAGCHFLEGAAGMSDREVHYKHGTLKHCRRHVREEHPTAKPDCDIYAIKDKIVWRGKFPWK